MKTILEELKEIKAKVEALINRLEAEDNGITTTIGDIRKIAILEEIFRLGGTTTAKQISELAQKYGKTPSSTAGYYSGYKPSLVATEDRKFRKLTKTGIQVVQETREKWGNNWLDRLPLEIISNKYTPDSEITF